MKIFCLITFTFLLLTGLIPISEGGERPEGGVGEFILSPRDSTRPRYHSSVAKLFLFNFFSYFFSISPHISLRMETVLIIILLSPNYFLPISPHISFQFFLIFPRRLSSCARIENNESQLSISSSSLPPR